MSAPAVLSTTGRELRLAAISARGSFGDVGRQGDACGAEGRADVAAHRRAEARLPLHFALAAILPALAVDGDHGLGRLREGWYFGPAPEGLRITASLEISRGRRGKGNGRASPISLTIPRNSSSCARKPSRANASSQAYAKESRAEHVNPSPSCHTVPSPTPGHRRCLRECPSQYAGCGRRQICDLSANWLEIFATAKFISRERLRQLLAGPRWYSGQSHAP